MTMTQAIALRIADLLSKNKLSRYGLCKKIAMTESTLRSIMHQKTKTVEINTILLICDGLGITLSEFFNDDLFKRENLDV